MFMFSIYPTSVVLKNYYVVSTLLMTVWLEGLISCLQGSSRRINQYMFAEYCENIFLRMCHWKWQLVNVETDIALYIKSH